MAYRENSMVPVRLPDIRVVSQCCRAPIKVIETLSVHVMCLGCFNVDCGIMGVVDSEGDGMKLTLPPCDA